MAKETFCDAKRAEPAGALIKVPPVTQPHAGRVNVAYSKLYIKIKMIHHGGFITFPGSI